MSQTPLPRQRSVGGAYLVAQPLDRVLITEPGRYYGLYGHVADVKDRSGPSVTGRDAQVCFALDGLGEGTRWFHADDLEVVQP